MGRERFRSDEARVDFYRSQNDGVESKDKEQEHGKEPESVRWFNGLTEVLFTEIMRDEDFHEIVKQKLEKAFNKDRPSIVNEIRVDSHDFGDKMIKVVSPIKVSETPLFQYVADFDVEFNGKISIMVGSSVALPFGKTLPVVANLVIRSIVGSARFYIPRGANPRCSLGFEEAPIVGVEVLTDFGGVVNIANLPKVGAFFERKAREEIIEALVLPSGGGFYLHLPIPYIRKAYFVTASKERKLIRAGEDLEEKLKTPAKKRLDRLSQGKKGGHGGQEEVDNVEKEEENRGPVEQHSEPVMVRRRSASMIEARPKKVVFEAEPAVHHELKPLEEPKEDMFGRASKRLFSLFESEEPSSSHVKNDVQIEPKREGTPVDDGDDADSEAEKDPFASAEVLPRVPSRNSPSHELSRDMETERRKREKLKKLADKVIKK